MKNSKKLIIKQAFTKYRNWRTMFFDHGDGHIYPEEILFPTIEYIQLPEPHALISDLFISHCEWYDLRELITYFAEQAFLCYESGFWHASISSAINCCEYILKYEYLRKLPLVNASELVNDKSFSLGYFTNQKEMKLKALDIQDKFFDKINFLNDVRVGLYHFNPRRIARIREQGTTETEKKFNGISDELGIPITASRVYSIMVDLINHFYNKEKRIQYLKEALDDYENKRLESAKNIEETTGMKKERALEFSDLRMKHFQKEYQKSTRAVKKKK